MITNIGVIKGQAYNASNSIGISVTSTNAVIKNNTIRNTGYHGISLASVVGAATVQYNFIDSIALVLDDAGGIYTTGADAGKRVIDHNIVLDAIGNNEGTNNTTPLSSGIYLDELSSNVTVTNNTVANCLNSGIKVHKGHDNTINNNTCI